MATKQETITEALERKAAEAKKKASKEKELRTKQTKAGFLNPFENTCTYEEFLAAVKESKKTIEDYCKGKLEPSDIEWLKVEINNLKK